MTDAITLSVRQRIQLRQWAQTLYSKPSLDAALKYCQLHFQLSPKKHTLSRALSPKYAHLDRVREDDPAFSQQKLRKPEWPVLEQILARWYIGVESQGIHITTEALQAKAQELWKTVAAARNYVEDSTNAPPFGPKWASLFKKRHGIRVHTNHSEPAPVSMQNNEAVEQRASELRAIIADYAAGNRYNMNQTGLFWRPSPGSGLVPSSQPGPKPEKSRISLGLTTNDTGDDRFTIWAIGKFKCPRGLKNFNWSAFNIRWASTPSAWFTTSVMETWLKDFYYHINTTKPGQKVLLLLDDFSAHVTAVDLFPPPPLIRIEFLPRSQTSVFQPLDQGIISSFKQTYRRQYIQWLIRTLNEVPDKDPVKAMDIRRALVWISECWYLQTGLDIVQEGWQKSSLLGLWQAIETPQQMEAELQDRQLWEQLARSYIGPVTSDPAVFFNPPDEDLAPEEPVDSEELFQQVVDEFNADKNESSNTTIDGNNEDERNNTDDAATIDGGDGPSQPARSIGPREAKEKVTDLISFAEDSESLISREELRMLYQLRDRIEGHIISNLRAYM